jgi:SAM-dependent methyltransferase
MAENDRWIWDEYWQWDRIASCFTLPGSRNYGEAIAGSWLGFFSGLADGSEVLDLCTGNGAIALLAAQLGDAGKKLRITAVDQAAVDPAQYVSGLDELLKRVAFKSEVNVEQLPFEDGSFDAVTSQYGIEYSHLPTSREEVVRVLRPGGQFRFVVHAAEGGPVAKSSVAVREVDHLLEVIDLVGAAERAFQAVRAVESEKGATESDTQAADRAFGDFCRAIEESVDFAETASDETMIRNCAVVLFDAFEKRQHVDLSVLMQKAQEVRKKLLAHRNRSAAMIASALTQAQAEELANWFSGATGQPSECRPLLIGDNLVGYAIQAKGR